MLRLSFTVFSLLGISALAHAGGITPRFGYVHDHQVVLQGDAGPEGLAGICGVKKENCRCVFTGGEQDSRIFTTAPKKASLENGTLTCPFPAGADSKDYAHVAVKSKSHGTSSAAPLKTKVSLADLFGENAGKKVNRVYKYTCERGFFEGEGVTKVQVACDMSDKNIAQRLGYITAPYDYYVYQNDKMPTFNVQPFTASFFPGICNRQANEFARSACSPFTSMQYGLSDERGGLFQVKVQLSTSPEVSASNPAPLASFGYAALADRHGQCAPGLEPAFAWQARPKSITAGSIDGFNPPSNFVNDDGSITNNVVGSKRPGNMKITRQASDLPCELGGVTPGNCAGATFKAPVTAQSVRYEKAARMPQLCVIAKRTIIENNQEAVLHDAGPTTPASEQGSTSAE